MAENVIIDTIEDGPGPTTVGYMTVKETQEKGEYINPGIPAIVGETVMANVTRENVPDEPKKRVIGIITNGG